MRLFLFLLTIFPSLLYSQSSISGKVLNQKTSTPVEYAIIAIPDQELWAITDKDGEFIIKSVHEGKINLSVTCLGFEKKIFAYNTLSDIPKEVILHISEESLSLKEVVVTAQKKKGEIATSYTIDRNSINHMQATSISDVLSLLPGGQTNRATNLISEQRIALRSISSTELDHPTFGTAIEVDGVRLSNNARFDGVSGIGIRNIGTHNIESIEMTTGLPSVEHGDLNSGLININTKKGKTPLEVEFIKKPLINSYSISKGFNIGKDGGVINAAVEHTRSFF
ncbi:MAG: carboxypeptidase-like regulatory domain-containing protein [Paludibacteraceae bacterium]